MYISEEISTMYSFYHRNRIMNTSYLLWLWLYEKTISYSSIKYIITQRKGNSNFSFKKSLICFNLVNFFKFYQFLFCIISPWEWSKGCPMSFTQKFLLTPQQHVTHQFTSLQHTVWFYFHLYTFLVRNSSKLLVLSVNSLGKILQHC